MQKKILWSVIIALVIIMVAIFYFLIPRDNQISTSNIQTCEPYLNISTAVKTGDVKACDCLTDQAQKIQCQGNFSDATIYTSAIKRMDLTSCERISKADMKISCVNIVKSKIDFAAKVNNLVATSTKQK